jgi:hypothetical protein
MDADALYLRKAASLLRNDPPLAAGAAQALQSVGVGAKPLSAAMLARLRAGFLRAYRNGSFTRGVLKQARRLGVPEYVAAELPGVSLEEIEAAAPGLPLAGLGGPDYANGDATLATMLASAADEAATDPVGSLPPR